MGLVLVLCEPHTPTKVYSYVSVNQHGFPRRHTHNSYCSKHGVSNLKLNKEITAMAQRWADHLASTGTFSHSQDRNFKGDKMGENIAVKWTSNTEDFTGMFVK